MAFDAYFDEIGTDGKSPAVVVAGMWASVERWKAFESQWEKALRDARLTHHHSVDYAASQGEYKTWKGDEPRRVAYMKRLIGIMHDTVQMAVTTAMVVADHTKLHPQFQKLFAPQSTCAHQCLGLMSAAINAKHEEVSTGLIFEDAPKIKGAIAEVYEHVNQAMSDLPGNCGSDWRPFASLSFAKKKERLPLQAADLLAYETAKHLRTQLGQENRMRQSLQALLGSVETYGQLMGEGHFKQWIRAWLKGTPGSPFLPAPDDS